MFKFINLYNILNVLGLSILLLSLFILMVIPLAIGYDETTITGIGLSFLIAFSIGALLSIFSYRRCTTISRRESFYIVVVVWFGMSAIGMLPYLFTGYIADWVDAFFESVSGFTTTGSTILSDIEALPHSLLFWRALTHWIGGLGILVLVVALIPLMNSSGSNLMTSEGSILDSEKIKPRVIHVAKRLWFVYLLLTVLETFLLWLEGMTLFDAVCHAFSTVATGGFSTKNSSVINMSPLIQYTITIFMILAGMNFVLLYQLGKGNIRQFYRDMELKYYLAIILAATLFITLKEEFTFASLESTFRSALFQVASIITATGFVSDNYELWHPGSQTIIVLLMLTGACVGSTGGGIKIRRHVITIKFLKQYFRKLVHPSAIATPKINKRPVKADTFIQVGTFTAVYVLTILFGTLVLQLFGIDHITAYSAVMTTLGGIGPGFRNVGPMETFASMHDGSKLYLCFNMMIGRLEILPVLALFHSAIRRP